jgi:hypothetical protein
MTGPEEMPGPEDKTGSGPVTVKIATDPPVIFADGALSQVFGAGIAKFFLYRIDPDPNAASPATPSVTAQIIMPAEGFAAMVHFFQHRLQLMVEAKAISKEALDRIRSVTYPTPNG